MIELNLDDQEMKKLIIYGEVMKNGAKVKCNVPFSRSFLPKLSADVIAADKYKDVVSNAIENVEGGGDCASCIKQLRRETQTE